jgi:hypothetical protein
MMDPRKKDYEIGLTAAESKYYEAMQSYEQNLELEVCCVGAGIGGGFQNTSNELHVMKYDEAMATKDVEQWHDAVEDEHQSMQKHVVFEEVQWKKFLKMQPF